MNQRHQELANQLVSAFRSGLDDAAQAQIGEAGFKRLHALACGALSQELDTLSGRLEGLLHELRTEVERPELGL
jgi:hypothetical protein